MSDHLTPSRPARARRLRLAVTAGLLAATGTGVGLALGAPAPAHPTAAEPGRAPATAGPLAAAGSTTTTEAAGDGSGGGGAVGGPPTPCPDLAGPADDVHLFTRTTGSGVTLRVYRLGGWGCGPVPADGSGVSGCGGGGLIVELSDAAAVGEGSGPGPGPVPQDPVSGRFGVAEGDPVGWVVDEVDPAVASATARFDGGGTDAMAPVDGVVALAAPAPTGDGGTLDLLDGAGAVLASVPFGAAVLPPAGDPPSAGGAPGTGSTSPVTPGVTGGGVACPLAVQPAGALSASAKR